MSIQEDFNEIIKYAHFWNWSPDWQVVKEIYHLKPESYSVLTPFAYTYLEEMIRSSTTEYGLPPFDRNGQRNIFKTGIYLINLAINENKSNQEYVNLLEKAKNYFTYTKNKANENGRNKVMHGHIHPRFWYQEDFEELIHFIALLSKHSKF